MRKEIERKAHGFLEKAGDPAEDHIWHRDSLLRLGHLARAGTAGAIVALFIAGHFGYRKWRSNKDQDQRLTIILVANDTLLSQAGEGGRKAFIKNLGVVLEGNQLGERGKRRFLHALIQDPPYDIYYKRGGLGVWQYDTDGVITTTLEGIRDRIVSESLRKNLEETISTIRAKAKEVSPR